MKEFCRKEINLQVLKLNNTTDRTVGYLKAYHQEVDIVDMSGTGEDMRRRRMEAIEVTACVDDIEALRLAINAATAISKDPAAIEKERENMFVKDTVSGNIKKIKMMAKKGKK